MLRSGIVSPRFTGWPGGRTLTAQTPESSARSPPRDHDQPSAPGHPHDATTAPPRRPRLRAWLALGRLRHHRHPRGHRRRPGHRLRPAWQPSGSRSSRAPSGTPSGSSTGSIPFIVGTLGRRSSRCSWRRRSACSRRSSSRSSPTADCHPPHLHDRAAGGHPLVVSACGRLRPGPLLRDTVDAFLIATLGWLPLFAGPSYGFSISTAGVILAIMILPTMVSIGREVLRSVPTHSARPCSTGSHALGVATRCPPYARSASSGR